MKRSIIITSLYIVAAVTMSLWVYYNSLGVELASDRVAGNVSLNQAINRLRGQLVVYRTLINTVAKDPRMGRALTSGSNDVIRNELLNLSLTYGLWEVDLINREGKVVASSMPGQRDFVFSPELTQAALNARMGYAIEIEKGERLVRFIRGVASWDGKSKGAIVLSVTLEGLEFEWPVIPEPVIFYDLAGISISSNRPYLLLQTNLNDDVHERFPLVDLGITAGTQLWQFTSDKGAHREVQVLNKDIPQLRMRGQILLDTQNARTTASLRMWLAAAIFTVLGLMGAIFVQQRRRLAMESLHSATLEQRVEERTAALKQAQNELVEASNLAALGRLSAGISHELNQPLAAILNFASNGRRLIERSKPEGASNNFSQIADQTRRITRIISNLRAFARQEHAPAQQVDLAEITRHTIELAQKDIASAGVLLETIIPEQEIIVMAGRVRMEQVLLNLISNALDAMQHSKEKILTITLEEKGEGIVLQLTDTGSGIKDPERVFEPFYTTKELGSSKGMGMGLALCFGIISRFGGQLTCANIANGACFIITLPRTRVQADPVDHGENDHE